MLTKQCIGAGDRPFLTWTITRASPVIVSVMPQEDVIVDQEPVNEMSASSFSRGPRVLAIFTLLAGFSFALYFIFFAGGHHWAVLRLAARQYQPNVDGDGYGHFPSEAIAQLARSHRDALVRSGHLLHRNYRFTELTCPSAEAHWVQTQFFTVHLKHAEPVFSTSGRSFYGDNYEIGVWFPPDEASFWDDWYAKHNDFDYIQSVMLDEHKDGITKR
jgi:hypothetical protein